MTSISRAKGITFMELLKRRTHHTSYIGFSVENLLQVINNNTIVPEVQNEIKELCIIFKHENLFVSQNPLLFEQLNWILNCVHYNMLAFFFFFHMLPKKVLSLEIWKDTLTIFIINYIVEKINIIGCNTNTSKTPHDIHLYEMEV